jgi:hypothetical protein
MAEEPKYKHHFWHRIDWLKGEYLNLTTVSRIGYCPGCNNFMREVDAGLSSETIFSITKKDFEEEIKGLDLECGVLAQAQKMIQRHDQYRR